MQEGIRRIGEIMSPQDLGESFQIDVIGDNSCFYWASLLAYLLPVMHDENQCRQRFIIIFGDVEGYDDLISELHRFNPWKNTSIFNQDIIRARYVERIRLRTVETIESHLEEFVDFFAIEQVNQREVLLQYCRKHRDSTAWAGDLEIRAFSKLAMCNVCLHSSSINYYPHIIDTRHPTIELVHTNFKGNANDEKNHYQFRLKKQQCPQSYLTRSPQQTRNESINPSAENPEKFMDVSQKGDSDSLPPAQLVEKIGTTIIHNNVTVISKDIGVDPFVVAAKVAKMATRFLNDEFLLSQMSLYIPGRCSKRAGEDPGELLDNEIHQFLKLPLTEASVCLVLGEAGIGKTQFSLWLAQKIWHQYLEKKVIPLYVSLAEVVKDQAGRDINHKLLENILATYDFTEAEIEYLREQGRFILILDSYDEIERLKQREVINLFAQNHFERWFAKVVISCRTDHLGHLTPGILPKFFEPIVHDKAYPELLRTVYVSKFRPEDVDTYIDKYIAFRQCKPIQYLNSPDLQAAWLDPKTYKHYINEIKITDLVRHPFVLNVTLDVLSQNAEKLKIQLETHQISKITQTLLIDLYVDEFRSREISKLIGNTGTLPEDCDLMADFDIFDCQFAKLLYANHLTVLNYVQPPSGGLSALFSQDRRSESMRAFDQLCSRRGHWGIAQRGSMVMCHRDNVWMFRHPLLLDHFVAKVENAELLTMMNTIRHPTESPDQQDTHEISKRM